MKSKFLKLLIIAPLCLLATACDDFSRFESERYICDNTNGLGLAEVETLSKGKSLRLTYTNGGTAEVPTNKTDTHYIVKTEKILLTVNRQTGEISGKRGGYHVAFKCAVHAFKM